MRTKLLKNPIMAYLFENKCNCGHVFYELDSQIPRACPGCGAPNPEARGFPPKEVK